MADEERKIDRREFLRRGVQVAGALAALGTLGAAARGMTADTVWQIDPDKCTMCGQCATTCVLTPSAVKCVHAYAVCGYCGLCFGYFEDNPSQLNTAAENVRCPTGAIVRNYIEDPYYEYTIDEPRCIGCAKCVKGCSAFGNGSLFLQVRHNVCQHCNQCSIAAACPADAFVRVPERQPYLLKHKGRSG